MFGDEHADVGYNREQRLELQNHQGDVSRRKPSLVEELVKIFPCAKDRVGEAHDLEHV